MSQAVELDKLLKEQNLRLEDQPSNTFIGGPYFRWINRRARLLDVGNPEHAEYLRQELIKLHEKYTVPLNWTSFDGLYKREHRDFQKWCLRRKRLGKDKDAHPNIEKSMEENFYVVFFYEFAKNYFNKKSFSGAVMRFTDRHTPG